MTTPRFRTKPPTPVVEPIGADLQFAEHVMALHPAELRDAYPYLLPEDPADDGALWFEIDTQRPGHKRLAAMTRLELTMRGLITRRPHCWDPAVEVWKLRARIDGRAVVVCTNAALRLASQTPAADGDASGTRIGRGRRMRQEGAS